MSTYFDEPYEHLGILTTIPHILIIFIIMSRKYDPYQYPPDL